MSIFVLVHGAWQTARTWDLLIPGIRAFGHAVTVPPLSRLETSHAVWQLLRHTGDNHARIAVADENRVVQILARSVGTEVWAGARFRPLATVRLQSPMFRGAHSAPGKGVGRNRPHFHRVRRRGYLARPVFQRFGDRAKRENWAYHELPTGPDCHVEMPEAFASILLETAQRSRKHFRAIS